MVPKARAWGTCLKSLRLNFLCKYDQFVHLVTLWCLAGGTLEHSVLFIYAHISCVSLQTPFAVEVFSGSGNWVDSLLRLVWRVCRHDILHGINVLDAAYEHHMKVMISTKRIRAITLAVCCTTFSRTNTTHLFLQFFLSAWFAQPQSETSEAM